MTRLEAVGADLRWRGLSEEITPDGREPYAYTYERVSRVMPWKAMVGRYTREGDVRELLGATDDMFVISRPGDDVSLTFTVTLGVIRRRVVMAVVMAPSVVGPRQRRGTRCFVSRMAFFCYWILSD